MPDFIFMGSFKCASSSVHFYLSQHPRIFTSTKKETGFFSLHYSKGMNFYEQFLKVQQAARCWAKQLLLIVFFRM